MTAADLIGATTAGARRQIRARTIAIRIRRDIPHRHPEHHEAMRTDLVFGIEPVRELIAAAPGSIRTLYVRSGDGQRFEEEMDRRPYRGWASRLC